tara:strand:- start:274 stop:576 length:303 start_codon:yes stop_codon:yes gene_type:complete
MPAIPLWFWWTAGLSGTIGASIGWFGNDIADDITNTVQPNALADNWFTDVQDFFFDNIDYRVYLIAVASGYIYLNRDRKKMVNVYKKKADWNKLYSAYKF